MRHLWYTRYRHWWHRTHPWSPAWLDDAICVHSHEAAWDDGGAPYWGGLQMDASFMATYGARFLAAWGTADQWTPLAQLIAAYRGYEARGWQPWPQTAAACGLL